jgi:ElaB/YqjD/DUF883 family membrane-anchored ribosome-binding protein
MRSFAAPNLHRARCDRHEHSLARIHRRAIDDAGCSKLQQEKLMADFTEEARIVAAESADDVTDGIEASVEAVKDSVSSAAASVRDIATDTVDDVVTSVSALIRERPLMAVGIAAGVAYLLGRLKA